MAHCGDGRAAYAAASSSSDWQRALRVPEQRGGSPCSRSVGVQPLAHGARRAACGVRRAACGVRRALSSSSASSAARIQEQDHPPHGGSLLLTGCERQQPLLWQCTACARGFAVSVRAAANLPPCTRMFLSLAASRAQRSTPAGHWGHAGSAAGTLVRPLPLADVRTDPGDRRPAGPRQDGAPQSRSIISFNDGSGPEIARRARAAPVAAPPRPSRERATSATQGRRRAELSGRGGRWGSKGGPGR